MDTRTEALQQARAQGERFRQIAELDGGVAWILDCATGELTYISAAVEALTGYAVSEVPAQLAGGGCFAELMAGLQERRRRFAAGDTTRRQLLREYELRRKDGSVVPVEVSSVLVPGDDGGADGAVVGLVRDIGARRRQHQERKRFASMLNHEFRTPLATIDGAIQRLEATGRDADEPTRQRYRKIQTAVDRLIVMLDDYLSPDRMDEIGHKRKADSVSPRALLEAGAAEARAAGREAGVSAADAPASLRCDPQGMQLALHVLVENAVKYTPAGTPIQLICRRAVEGGVELLVQDNGPGIPEDEQASLFDKFFRGRNAAGVRGSGLGLYMARAVIEVHGGMLTVRNADGGGAEFRAWLPAHEMPGKNVAPDGGNSDNSISQLARVGAGLPKNEPAA